MPVVKIGPCSAVELEDQLSVDMETDPIVSRDPNEVIAGDRYIETMREADPFAERIGTNGRGVIRVTCPNADPVQASIYAVIGSAPIRISDRIIVGITVGVRIEGSGPTISSVPLRIADLIARPGLDRRLGHGPYAAVGGGGHLEAIGATAAWSTILLRERVFGSETYGLITLPTERCILPLTVRPVDAIILTLAREAAPVIRVADRVLWADDSITEIDWGALTNPLVQVWIEEDPPLVTFITATFGSATGILRTRHWLTVYAVTNVAGVAFAAEAVR